MATFDVTPGFGDDEALADNQNYSQDHSQDHNQDSSEDGSGSRSFTPFSFPRGPRAGVALHTLLEYFDFTRSAEDQLPLITQCLDRIGLLENRADWTRTLENWLSDIVTTPLVDGVTLEQVEAGMRLDEMEFHFPLATDNSMLQLLQSNGYLDEAVRPNLTQLSGMMTGLIDLVFAHGGRFYIVDYKSNYLGNTATHYETLALQQAIKHHQYDLQYLIYCVALTRYLRNRVPDYRYETHFGGVFYLFLRGMQGVGTASASNTTGVFFDRPDEAFLARLDQIMGDAR
ncbi:MAG: PD-(D/E)XK nuclease family protein [Pseudomonadales bacterium]